MTGAEAGEAEVGEVEGGEFAAIDGEVAEAEEFAPEGQPLLAVEFLTDAVGGELLVAPLADAFGIRAMEDFDDVVQADGEAAFFLDAVDAGEEFLGGEGGVEGVSGFEAVIAGGAGEGPELFAEVGKEGLSAAGAGLGVAGHLVEFLAGGGLFVGVFDLVDEVGLFGGVASVEEEQAIGGQAIAAGATGFLVVAFDVAWEVVVDDPADVGLIDAHAEGDGSADDSDFIAEEEVLVSGPDVGIESGVVGAGGYAGGFEAVGERFGTGAGSAVDDAGVVGSGFEEVLKLLEGVFLGGDAVEEVWSVEAGDEVFGLAEAEVAGDIGSDFFGGGGGKGHDGRIWEEFTEVKELAVFRSEVVSPFGHAVGFIDGEGFDVPGLEVFAPIVEDETFGGGVEEAVMAFMEEAHSAAVFVGFEAGVEEGGGDAGGFELIDLVFHEGDEWRDDECEPGADEGG